MFDTFLFAAIPYLAVTVAVIGGIARYSDDRYSYSSFSSQLLESRVLFWGSISWHYPVLLILGAHVVALAFWRQWADVLASPVRLWGLEVGGLALSFLAFAGLTALLVRRLVIPRVRAVTSPMDWVLLLSLLAQIGLGIWIAIDFRWGSSWFTSSISPWLISLFKLNPEVETVAALPVGVQVHALFGFFIIALVPFTRLVHAVTVPVSYLWRPFQVVIWNRRSAR
ncbi:MAG: respiratory nitrate reductase subunit gamma [Gaiellales bacterium]